MNLWKRKLLFFLHDNPTKCLNIFEHENISKKLLSVAGFDEEEILKAKNNYGLSDSTAAAADRFPFPHYKTSNLTATFDGQDSGFRHPLSGPSMLRYEKKILSSTELEEVAQTVQPILQEGDDKCTEEERWFRRFMVHWRLWQKHAIERDPRLAFLPADTRIPDHTIWNHMSITSAMASCIDVKNGDRLRPAFLKLQIGGVQEFISQARSTRDLWSGSYLLSWLMAAGIKALSSKIGPDCVIYPNLLNQPIVDFQWKNDLWDQIHIGEESVWKRSLKPDYGNKQILTPSLPNVFFAIVPSWQAHELGKLVESALHKEWQNICNAVIGDILKKITQCGLEYNTEQFKIRFEKQCAHFLKISYASLNWPEDWQSAKKLAEQWLPRPQPNEQKSGQHASVERFNRFIKTITQEIEQAHRDKRFYTDEKKENPNNVGITWSLLVSVCNWCLDAVRQTQSFDAWTGGGWQNQTGKNQNKDSLNGRDEMLLGGANFTNQVKNIITDPAWKNLFKHDDYVGAITLVKRTWHLSYLKEKWGLDVLKMSNTYDMARGNNHADSSEDDPDKITGDDSSHYYAILALDGDHIGKWVSGEKTPPFKYQFSDSAQQYFKTENFKPQDQGNFLDLQRMISPGYHLQFSEALSNFSRKCVSKIVKKYNGQLIYSGGDDVLAILPATKAVDCAEALRLAFSGENVCDSDGNMLFKSHCPGFLSDGKNSDEIFIVPGAKATCSTGISIVHEKHPLQDAVQKAQAAEKRAKNKLGRKAVSITLIKRGGEMHEWGYNWDNGANQLLNYILTALRKEWLSSRFPQRVQQLLFPYLSKATSISGDTHIFTAEDAMEIILLELNFALKQQGTKSMPKEKTQEIMTATKRYLNSVYTINDEEGQFHASIENNKDAPFRALIGLMQYCAFIHRKKKIP